jgi:uncharacterized protein (DUF1778 family)
MRFEFRIQSDDKRAVEAAAELVHQAPSDFVREAAVERAASVIEAHLAKTIVQADFFDALLDSLDQPSLPNAALRSAASRQHQVVKRDR